MGKGRITIPTDESFVEGTKKIAALWGADAVRDCDGTKLPANALELAEKVYNTYFVVRGDNAWADKHTDELQSVLLMTDRYIATNNLLTIDLLKGYSHEQLGINEENPKKYWQVYDRTTGEEVFAWKYSEGKVIIENAIPFHEYTVNFFAKNLWDSTQMYNYITNNWNIEKHKVMEPRFPTTFEHIKGNLKKWCNNNKNVNVVRFTTFLYHFFLVFNEENKEKHVDWFGYPMTASPRAFDEFYREYGYEIKSEDIVDGGSYHSNSVVLTEKYKDYMDFTQKYVAKTVRMLTDIVHSYGKEAMMFLGDSWIGTEIFGEHFKELNLDALVGSVGGGVTVRMLSDVEGVRYKEGRFLPYFFPDTFFEGNEDNAVAELNRNWITARRAMMRNPLDRIGFGGYLSLAAKFPKFINRAAEICDEFRYIYDTVKTQTPRNYAKVAVLNSWGKIRSWMCNMTAHELWYQQSYSYQGIYEALSGLPVEVSFINFDDVKNGKLKDYDVVINAGDAGTAWSGGENWLDEKVVTEIRKFVYNGGGFIGVGEPTAVQHNGKFFQLSDVLGVDKECGISLGEDKYNIEKHPEHFITKGIKAPVDYGEDKKNIYALNGTNVIDIAFSDRFIRKVNVGEVKMATSEYGKGRSFYITGLPYSAENAKLLYRAILWTGNKENLDEKSYCENPLTEAHFYGDRFAVTNNTDKKQTTVFYDIDGNAQTLELKPYEIKWITVA